MVTKMQAMTANYFHCGNCSKTVGPRGGVEVNIETWRRNGRTQTWKRDPSRFRVPIKFGMYAYGELNESNAGTFHTADDCPLRQKPAELQRIDQHQEIRMKGGI